MHWQMDIGNVLLVRADDRDLSVEDAALLCRFCERKLLYLFEDAMGSGLVQRTKKEVVHFITAERMQAYREELRDQTEEPF